MNTYVIEVKCENDGPNIPSQKHIVNVEAKSYDEATEKAVLIVAEKLRLSE